jgi:hypothetical protein
MQDLHSSPLLWEAQMAERHREIEALATSRVHDPRNPSLRTSLANLLAHVALHLDQHEVGSLVAHHPHSAGRS